MRTLILILLTIVTFSVNSFSQFAFVPIWQYRDSSDVFINIKTEYIFSFDKDWDGVNNIFVGTEGVKVKMKSLVTEKIDSFYLTIVLGKSPDYTTYQVDGHSWFKFADIHPFVDWDKEGWQTMVWGIQLWNKHGELMGFSK